MSPSEKLILGGLVFFLALGLAARAWIERGSRVEFRIQRQAELKAGWNRHRTQRTVHPRKRNRAQGGKSAPRPVRLNQATAAELSDLPGIGETLASRIIAERSARGGFRSKLDLLRVKGVSISLYKKIEKFLVADP